MKVSSENSIEIFSYHLVTVSFSQLSRFLLSPISKSQTQGLNHSECFFTMNLGTKVSSLPRYNFKTMAMFAWWQNESCLDSFLKDPAYKSFAEGWHVRMRLYRTWGKISELDSALVFPELANPQFPVVAVTLARLNLMETPRFIKWGKPVEAQVRDHKGQRLALAAMRPLNSFSTFSVWKDETEMTNMVRGHDREKDGKSHQLAMKERSRKDFHSEFMTMRFIPLKEFGEFNGKSNFTGKADT